MVRYNIYARMFDLQFFKRIFQFVVIVGLLTMVAAVAAVLVLALSAMQRIGSVTGQRKKPTRQ